MRREKADSGKDYGPAEYNLRPTVHRSIAMNRPIFSAALALAQKDPSRPH